MTTTMTPLSVYLPFNMDCLRGEFTPAKRGGGPPAGTGRWLIVQDQKLLAVPDGDGFRLPAGATPEAPPRGLDGLGPRHWLGTSWALAETGAAGPTGNRYGDAAGHSCFAVAGVIEAARTLETKRSDREANMWAFTRAALELLDTCLQQAGETS